MNAPQVIDWNSPDLAMLRAAMLRFARVSLRDAAAAEDMVQEALLAAMQSVAGFDGRSSLKTWMFAILRHKIVDHIRKSSRERPIGDFVSDNSEADAHLDAVFARRTPWNGEHWTDEGRPSEWPEPDAALEQRQFWEVFDACVHRLPENLSRVFMMRELLDLETPEICRELGISTNNCWVILHRARTRLRGCLEHNWFDEGAPKC
ncbi:MAG: sigma-70 family RNA polymerase sigma factor [Zoogloeaceae bacterium]|nr:sigma-70 family RNA polymerase sigma factor [Zoogloeaceae bacterium]